MSTDTIIADELTAEQAAERLRLHVNTVAKHLRSGEYPNAYFLGRSWRIPLTDITAFIERRRQAARDERALRSAGKKLPAVS